MGIRQLRVCPVCGHKNWCTVFDGKEPGTLYYCCHYPEGNAGEHFFGSDGREYVLIKQLSDDSGWTVETAEQRRDSERKWRETHAFENNIFSECPVCGRVNECSWFHSKKSDVPNARLIVCKSQYNQKESVITGMDNQKYRLIKQSNDGAGWLLETYAQYKEGIRIWKEKKFAEETSENKRPINVQQTRFVQPKQKSKEVPSNLLPNEKLDKVYRHVINMLTLLPEHREILRSDGWPDELIEQHHIVSMPLPDKKRWLMEKDGIRNTDIQGLPWRNAIVKSLQETFGKDLTGIPGFYNPETADRTTGEIIRKWQMAGAEGIFFFMTDIRGHFFGAQIRLDNPGVRGKYRAWSTNPEVMTEDNRQCYPGGTGLPVQAGLIYNPERDHSYVAYITEGWKKGIIGNYLLRAPFVPLTGVGQFKALVSNPDPELNVMDYLKKQGTKVAVVAFDADKAVNAEVLKHERNTVRVLQEQGFQVMLADWTQHRERYKGLDDLLLAGLRPDFQLVNNV